ncbi:hypothetical protein FEDK69T_05260 [Flavobacterium enshiense DK69]|uniref:Adhesin n=1 Tax=Flavobacterium enshiense DK69 TaxID=1107311 RepID=V6SJJ6_9FLAO|nr:choice-of-anchor J domain-containing protein [Flavobacterium enshiense]ESU24605.1 hypothetical protein FEDK69T_05260 [Flavobacterium enshiense DK69]KGO95525.1 hypothetical protein Q767_12055 [Flavobacterium enshiense DK69]
MKKITIVIFMLLISLLGFAQLPEGFESGIPATWKVMDNNVGTVQSWVGTSTSPYQPAHGGTWHAYINREAVTAGQTAEDWLVTPLVAVPANGQLRFWTKMTLPGDNGTVYQVRVSTTSQSDRTTFVPFQEWTETQLETEMIAGGAADYSAYGEIVKNLSAYAGQSVYVAFVKSHTPTVTGVSGDRWLIDDVNITQQCASPSNLTASAITLTTAQLGWTSTGPATSWDIEMVLSAGTQTGVPTATGVTNPVTYTGLTEGTQYKYYVRSNCGGGNTSVWVGPYYFNTIPYGQTCAAPIAVTTLPYAHTSNTGVYGDVVEGSPGSSCGITGNYLNGNDVFYAFTPSFTGAVDISMTTTGTNSGIFVYANCNTVGTTCLAGSANAAAGIRNIPNFTVTAGTTYYLVISSTGSPQIIPYTLNIQQIFCAQPTALTTTAIAQNTATLAWTSAFSAFQYVVQPAGTGLPPGAGLDIAGSSVSVSGLSQNTQYEFYVRADCGNGQFSIWSGPYTFRTLCGPIAIPFTEGFNSNSSTQVCWAVANVNGDANAWNMDYTTNPHEGDQAASIVSSASTNDDWLMSPQLILNGNQRLRYRYRVGSATSPCNFEIRVSTTGPIPANFTTIILPQASYSNVTYVEKIVNIPPTITGNVNIGWHVAPGANGSRIYIDQVIVEDIPPCPQPMDIVASGITPNSASINWTPGGTETTWQVVVQPASLPAPTSPTQGTTVTTPPPYAATGLLGSTTYNVYVLANCGADGPSVWSEPISFTTLVAPPVCGGTFVDAGGSNTDYANNSDLTWTIYPATPGDVVTVTFSFFNTEANWDGLYVYNGNSTAAPQIPSTNGAGNGPLTLPGAFWGTTIPGPFRSSAADGSLTFRFRSDSGTTRPGWVANVTCALPPTCVEPLSITQSGITHNSVNLAWTGGNATAWEVIAVPCGSPRPTAATAGWVPAPTNPFTLTGLNGSTCYDFYVRGVCTPTDSSSVTGPVSATTLMTPPQCGGVFTDAGGSNADYANSSDLTWTIYPTTPGDVVTVTFTSFDTEANWDGLYVYNGNSTAAPQIPSTNGAGSGPLTLPGAFWGTTIPGPFRSSAADGSLTFRFRSDSGGTRPGWVANVTCAPTPTCIEPVSITQSGITNNSVNLAWTGGNATAWEVIALPCGSPRPTAATAGWVPAPTNPFTLTGLIGSTCYDFYVRGICSSADASEVRGPVTATTQITPPVCGGTFTDGGGPSSDYANSSNLTWTICPTTPGDVVTVTFTSFDTEANWDALYVFDGNSINAPQIASTNGAGNVPGGLSGGYWGTTGPGQITSTSPDGCLTFKFRSDGFGTEPGWTANVTCAPRPACSRPSLPTATQISSTSALLGWAENGTATQWQVLVLPLGSPAPTPGTSGTIVNSNPALITGLNSSTQYTFYVSAICSPTEISIWSVGHNFTTAPANDECATATFVPVNGGGVCDQTVMGTLSLATGSAGTPIAPCVGTPDDDVWYQFIATNSYLNVSLQNVAGSTDNLNFAVYSGTCNGLTQMFCSAADELTGTLNGLTVGQTYYVRVYSNEATPQTTTFNLCISTPSTCSNASTACASNNYGSTTGVTDLGAIGCLSTSPNPRYFVIQVGTSGPINFLLTQSSPGSPTPDLDVDYAAWGPFTSSTAGCAAGIPFIAPVNTNPSANNPQDHGCSYSAESTEQFNIPNAQAGEFYVILITNYADETGIINFNQINAGTPGAGSTFCCQDANFSYSPTTYCKGSSANPVATIAQGSVAGTFSSPNNAVVFANTATGEIDLAATPAGNYVINNTLAPTASCGVKTYSFVISIVAPPTATISYAAPTFCKSLAGTQDITVTGTPGGNFTVEPVGLNINAMTGAITPSGSVPGTYTVWYYFPASTGCSGTRFSTTVTINALPAAAPTVVQPTCTTPTGTITVLPTGASYEYSIDGGLTYLPTNVFSDLAPNSYNVVIRDTASGCTSTAIVATVNSTPTAPTAPTATATSPTTCAVPTGSVTVSDPVGANYEYSIDGTTFQSGVTFLNLLPGSYNVVVRDVTSGCVSTVTPVTVNPAPGAPAAPTASVTVQPSCVTTTGTIVVTAPTGATLEYSLDGTTYQSATTFAGLTPGNYNVSVRDTASGCISSAISLVVNPIPASPAVPTATATVQPTCAVSTGTIEVSAPQGSNYEYSVNGTTYQPGATFNGLVSGSYNVTVRDITTGCVSSATVVVIDPAPAMPSAPSINITVQPTCDVPTASIEIIAPLGAGYEYSVDASAFQSGTVFTGLAIGMHTVFVRDIAAGCTSQSPIEIIAADIPNTPELAVVSQPVCFDGKGSIKVDSPLGADYEYSLNGGAYQSNPVFAGLNEAIYTITVKDVLTGCISSAESIDLQDSGCEIPKGISPNNDGANDEFDLSSLNIAKLSIFNRYGVAAYTYGAGYTKQWHGQSDAGQELPDGTYYYVIDTTNGQTRTGWVYINREQ